MKYHFLPYRPLQAGYSVDFGDGTESISLDGGSGRYRAGIQGSAHIVPASFGLQAEDYSAFMGFWRARKRDAQPFEVDLQIDEHELKRYVAHFVPKSLRLASVSGDVFTVSVKLEVDTLPEYDEETLDYWASLVMFLSIYGSFAAAREIMNLLAKLSNEDLPHAK